MPLRRPDRHDAQGRGRGAPRRQGLRPGRPSARRDRGCPQSGPCRLAPPTGARRPRHRRMASMIRLTYPVPPTDASVDDYHGTLIADPYRPLEDSDAPACREWIAAQNELTARVLDGVPARRSIRARLAEAWNYPRAGAPWRRGDTWFQLRNTGLQDQDVLWAGRRARGRGQGAPRPEPLERPWDDGPRRDCGRPERGARRLRHERRRLGLAHLGRAARRDGRGAARSGRVEQVLLGGLDP